MRQTLLFIFATFFFSQACHYYRVRDVYRKRRELTNQNSNTDQLRNYFTRCMESQSSVTQFDWRTIIDFTIMDTTWFENAEQVYCSASTGGASSECWQRQVECLLLQEDSGLLERVQRCIFHYAEDRNSNPPQDRYALARTKRQIMTPSRLSFFPAPAPPQLRILESPSSDIRNGYLGCLKESTLLPADRAPLSYRSLSQFAQRHFGDGRCRAHQDNHPITWPFRLIAVTRGDSPLRISLKKCAEAEVPNNSFWTDWGIWGACSATCGRGMQIRRRSCKMKRNPFQSSSGCPGGSSSSARSCRGVSCPHSFHWSPWVVNPCSHTCGKGMQTRSRSCRNDRNFDVSVNFCLPPGSSHTRYHQSRICFQQDCLHHNWFENHYDDYYDDDRK